MKAHMIFFRKMPPKELKNQKKILHSSSRNDFICKRKIICQIKSLDKRENTHGITLFYQIGLFNCKSIFIFIEGDDESKSGVKNIASFLPTLL